MSKNRNMTQHNTALGMLATIFSHTVDNRTGNPLPSGLAVGLYPQIARDSEMTVKQAVVVAHEYASIMEN